MNLDGWEIDVDSLPGPKRGEWPALYFTDAIFPSPDGRCAAVLYSITEMRMGWDVGALAVFRNRDKPRLLLNSEQFLCCSTNDSIIWLTNDVFAAKKHYYDASVNKLNVPFAIIDLACNRYSYIALANSYPYGLAMDHSGIRLVENARDDRFPTRNGEHHQLEDMVWYPLSELRHFDTRYAKDAP